jgi:hypothetical protein
MATGGKSSGPSLPAWAWSSIPLIYFVVIAALLKVEWLATFTDDARMMVITAVINLALGSLIGYAYGTTIGSQKKDAALAAK